jgi:broad specificity phosphatase PhoE
MVVRVALICQGTTAAIRAARFPADEPLDEAARRQLPGVGPPGDFDLCWTSPARAAIETAAALGLKAAVEPQLRECDYGRWAGRSLVALREGEPEALAQWLEDPAAAPHGGEALLGLTERVAAWLDGLAAKKGCFAAVSHASVIRAAALRALEVGPRSFWRMDVAPLSQSVLSGEAGRWRLVRLNAPLDAGPTSAGACAGAGPKP